jgi:hypothetical protein
LEVFDESLGKEHRVGNAVMEIPGKSVAKLQSIQLDIQTHRYKFLDLICLLHRLFFRDLQLRCKSTAGALGMFRV